MHPEPVRYIGLDIHKHFVMLAAVDEQHQMILSPRRIGTKQLASWASTHLLPSDQLIMEATTNVWVLHDLLRPHVASVTVVHPFHVKIITASFVKTDKRDALALAKLLVTRLAPAIWIPPQHVRELRSLVTHRKHLMKQCTAAKNRLQGVIFRYNLTAPQGDLYARTNRAWWQSQDLGAVEALRIRQDLNTIDFFKQQIQELERNFAQLSCHADWQDLMPYLMQLPGVALLSAMTILGAIGDIQRFPSSDKLVGYAGLGGRVRASGKSYHSGKITKQGRSELRYILLEVAWAAVQNHAIWRERYQLLAKRCGSQKAITAVARRILVVIWHVLSKKEVYRDTTTQAIENKFLRWAYSHRLARSQGYTGKEFVQHMMQKFNRKQETAAALAS